MGNHINSARIEISTIGVIEKIKDRYEDLSVTERKIADRIMIDPNIATSLSISELASLYEVGDATVVRFYRSIGFGSFREFRLSLAQDLAPRSVLGDWDTPHGDIEISDDMSTVARKVTRANIDALFAALEKMDIDEMERAVAVMIRARQINVYGEGTSGAIAQDAVYRLLRVGLPVQYFTSHMAFVVSSLLTHEDATIAISHSGRTREVIEAQEVARDAGAATICITSFPNSPLARLSDIKLVVPASHRQFMAEAIPWRIVQMSIIDILSVRLWQHFGKDFCRERVEKIDSALKGRRL